MKALPNIKKGLREHLIEEGGVFVINSLLDLLPANNPKCDALIALKAEYQELKTASMGGRLLYEEKEVRLVRLNTRLLDFIRELEAEDFDASIKRSKLSGKPKIQRGHVLYQIPQEMQLGEESRCLVRIAFDKEMILEALDLDEQTTLKSGLRISEYMKVEIKDPAGTPVFDIRTTSTPVQFIDEDDYTEWRFWVKPLKLGKHMLALKVSVIQRINGEDHIREKTLDESVVIITEAPAAEAVPSWKKDSEPLLMPCALETVAPRRLPGLSGGMRAVALGLALLMGVSSVAYAYNPSFHERVDLVNALYIQDDEEGYEKFNKEHPDSKHKEKILFHKAKAIERDDTAHPERAEEAMLYYINEFGGEAKYIDEAWWTVAQLSQNPEDYQQYLALEGEQPREAEAQKAIAQLEPKLWKTISSQPSAVQLDRFLRIYPNSTHSSTALQQLADSTIWQATPTLLPTRLLRDTTGWQQRLQTYAVTTAKTDSVLARKLQVRAQEPVLYQASKATSPASNTTSSTTEKAAETENTSQLAANNTEPEVQVETKNNATRPSPATATNPLTEQPGTTKPPPCIDEDEDGICADQDCNDDNPSREASVDTDGDGVCDDIDQCDEEIGTSENNGCPDAGGGGTFIAPEMISIEGGTFEMGDTFGDAENGSEVLHTVTLSDFQLGKNEVTFTEYDTFCEATNRDKPTGPGWGRGQRPVINVSWYDAVDYCNWLSVREGFTPVYTISDQNVTANWTANGYRLPTEAEWEYAARQRGQNVRFGNGKDIADPRAINFNGSEDYKEDYSVSGVYRLKTFPVGSLGSPNSLGLHDMSGNVDEWCWDWGDAYNYEKSPSNNPRGPESGSSRVRRGGSWSYIPAFVRCTVRGDGSPGFRDVDLGFRLARNSTSPPPCIDQDEDGICADQDCNDDNPSREASTDSDGDGVCDDIDQCDEAIGTLENKGCPAAEVRVPFIAPKMISISGGTFEMGDVMGDSEEDNETVHTVTVSGFQLGKYEVTFAEYDAFCEASKREKPADEGWGRGQRPVINISWYDAVEYCNWLSVQYGYTPAYTIDVEKVSANWNANGYRLPTEAEWEYAARQKGQTVRFGNGKDIADPAAINFDGRESYQKDYSISGTSKGKTVPVGSLRSPNSLGLHDMSGNVYEWCWDRYGSDYYANSSQNNPKGADSGSYRVARGGIWNNTPQDCRAASRSFWRPTDRGHGIGFRLARSM